MFDYVKNVVRRLCGQTSVTFNKTPRIIEKSEHGINPKLVSWQAKKTCEALQKRGFKAFIVGGAVRDLLLGVAPKDFDVVTDATPEQVKRSQRRAIIIGRRFQIVHVLFGPEIIECSTFRALDAVGVRKDAEGRVVSDNVFGPMWQDAARRDFTINALYYDPVTEQVYDYHNGLKDLAQRRLRIIGSASERYREDPVRMMRATRIAGKLGLSIEPATKKPIIQMAELLRNVPAARLFDEMMKLFTCGKAEICLKEMRKNHLLHPLMPVLDVILSEPQGEEFLMLAMHRTDERIAIGKKISPSFLFATLLWPQVKKRWDAYQSRPRTTRVSALFQASEDVAATQCNGLLIQNRFIVDMKIIWMLQVRFERRTGKNPYTLISHPKYRAGYDFMLLRSQLGHVPEEQVHWWEAFVAADDATREAMVLSEEKAAGKTPAKSRRRTKVPKGAVSESEVAEALQTLESERKVRRPRKRHRNRVRANQSGRSALSPNLKEAPDDFVTAYVGLGANLGDAQATLRAALSQMDRLAHTRLVSCSSFYRTEPIDSFGDDYINAVACLTTKLSPADLLSSLQEIETRYGRVRPAGVHNAPRTLDLDLLLYADLKSEDPELTLPHPRMKNRAFVLVPLFEIAPAGFASLDLLPDVLLPGVSGQRITCVTKALFLSPSERGGF